MKARMIYATNSEEFNRLLTEAIDLIEASGCQVDGIEWRCEHFTLGTYHREYIALVTSGIRVNQAPLSGQLLTIGESQT